MTEAWDWRLLLEIKVYTFYIRASLLNRCLIKRWEMLYKKIVLCLLFLTVVGCKTIVEPAGNDDRLIGTSWRTEFGDPTEYFHFNDPEGENGLYFVLLDSCYQVLNVDIHFGRFIIEDIDHPYDFQDSLLEVTYPVYNNENPDEIVGDIKVRFVRAEFDSASLNYCE